MKNLPVLLAALFTFASAQMGWGQTTIGIHDFETVNASPAMTRTMAPTGSPTPNAVTTGNTSSSYSPPSSPFFTSSNSGYQHGGGSALSTVTHTFSAVDTRNYTGVSVSLRVAAMSKNSANGVESDDYCEIAVSPDNGTTWYQQSRLTGNATNGNKRWAFSGTGAGSRAYLANNTFTTHAPPAGSTQLISGADAITTLTVTGLPAVQSLRVRVQTRNDSGNEVWVIDDVRVSGTLATTAPTVTSSAATSISTTGATLNGNVTATGGANLTERGFHTKTSSGVTTSDTKRAATGTETGAYTLAVTGLSVNTRYYFKSFATNSAGTSLSSTEEDFWTLANAPSTPTLSGATATGMSVAIGSGDGNPATTQYAIQTTNGNLYVQAGGTLGASEVWQTAATWGTRSVSGLTSSTSYTWRVKARNGANTETAFGSTASLSTSAPSSPTLTAVTLASALTATFPSASTGVSFTAAGANLTGNITVTAETGYEVSTTLGSGYGGSVVVASGTTVYVRLAASRAAGNYNSATAAVLSGGGASSSANITTSSSGNTISAATPPTLTAAPAASVDAAFDVTFTDNATWRTGISGITVDGTPLTAGFAVAAGTITFTPSASVPAGLLQSPGTKEIFVTSANHGNATVSQAIAAGAATQLAVTTQPAAPASNGAALATQPVVEVLDQYGNLTTSTATVTAAVGVGTWTLGGTAAVDAVSGTTTFAGLTATSVSAVTGATIEFTSPGLTEATSGTFNIPAPVIDYVALTAIGTAATENFDSIGSSATATLPNGFKIGTDYASGTTATTLAYGSTGTGAVTGSSSGGVINWADGVTASATDRALGFLNTGSFTSPRSIVAKIRNSTGLPITTLAISWDYEKYRSGSRAFDWTFFHGSSSSPDTAATDGNQSYAADANNTTISNPPTSTAKNVTLTGLNIANGADYYLRFTFTGVGGSSNGQGMAIDDFSITSLGNTTLTIDGSSDDAASADFTTTYGTASAAQTFTIGGSGLQGDVTATAGTGFEVSSDGITYGPSATFPNSSGSASGTLHARLAANAAASATYTSATVATLSSPNATSYSISTDATGSSVSLKALTISGASATNRTYNATTTVAVSGGSLVGVETGDTANVTLSTASATGAVAAAAVGDGKAVTVTGYSISGTASGNYSLTQPAGLTVNITQKALTVTGLTGANKVYDGNTTATATGTAALSGVESGDTVTLEGTPAFTFASANVGTGISITTSGYTLGGASAGNYSLTQPTLSANITAASQTITGLPAAETRLVGAAAYDLAATASSSLTVSYSSSDEAVATISGATVTIVGPGTTTITASQAGDANYAAATPITQTLTVLPTTWTLIEDFAGLNTGNLSGQNGWANAANSSGTVGADPANAANLVGILQAGDQIQNYKNLAIAGPGQTATMFLRFRIGKIDNDTVNNTESAGFMGISDAATPSAFGSFRAQWGTNPVFSTLNSTPTTPFHLVSHNPTPINKFLNQQAADSLWYHAWAVLDKTNAKYSLYLQGGEFTTPTLITEISTNTSAFDFRGGGNLSDTETLKVYLRSGTSANHQAPLYFDDIYLAAGENLTPPVDPVHVPIVATGTAGSITRTSATITGNDVSSDGNSAITERGVVFSTSANPTIADTKVVVAGTTGSFAANLTGLAMNTPYFVRAFATNAIGTAYGSDVSFTTLANNLPTFAGMSVSTVKGSPVNILRSKILAKAADADGDAVTISAVSSAIEQGGTATLGATVITYTPAPNFSGPDSINVTLSDGIGTVNHTITVTVTEDPLFTRGVTATAVEGGALNIGTFGIPGRTYGIQRSTTMAADSWTQIDTVTAAADSTVNYVDPTPPTPAAFYRVVYPADPAP